VDPKAGMDDVEKRKFLGGDDDDNKCDDFDGYVSIQSIYTSGFQQQVT
jgi:hypothetical protein